jgi:peptide/nickel transport system substrate-binding protein
MTEDSNSNSTRRRFLTIAGTGATAAVAGCLGGGDSSSDNGDGGSGDGGSGDGGSGDGGNGSSMSGGTLQMMATGSIQTLDPTNAKGSGAGYNQYNQQLLHFPDGEYPPEPALARDYEVSDDGLTYTFNLREDAKFHDGTDITAQDVVYSFRRVAESANSRNKDDIVGETMQIQHEKDASLSEPTDEETLADVVPESLAVEAVDDYTFEMTLASPFQYTDFQIAGGTFAILPENSVGDIEGYDGEYEYNEFFSTEGDGPTFAGAGPFQVDSWEKGSQISLSSFSDYYDGEPNLDNITYTVVGDGNTRVQRFANENADILTQMPTATYSPDSTSIESQEGNKSLGTYTLDNGTQVNYGELPSLTTEYIVFNTIEVPLPVRRAFAYAMNQDDIVENIYKGTAKAAYHIVPPAAYPTFEEGQSGNGSYNRHAESGYQSNTDFGANGYPYGYGETMLDEASRVMEEAGYGDSNRYSVTATTISGRSDYRQVFTTLQEKLRAAYIDMEIVEAEFGTIISNAINGEMEVFGLGDGMEYPGPQNFLRFLYGEDPSGQFTRWGAEGSNFTEEYRQTALDAWQNNYDAEGTTPSDHAEAFQTVEEMNWASVQELPFAHPKAQRFWQQGVDVNMHGVMENQAFDDTSISQ